MRYIAVALAQFVAIAWLIWYATEPDDYYRDGTTRWEHATNGGGAVGFVAALVIATSVGGVFLARGLLPTRVPVGQLLIPAGLLYCISLAAAWVFINFGH